ncbi:MAG: class I SAM-dependent methyltransferase [Vampirovibrionales bacterium]|nr:class I SAM-dependent methyltransferase [Vampirovibrionales bacterium]
MNMTRLASLDDHADSQHAALRQAFGLIACGSANCPFEDVMTVFRSKGFSLETPACDELMTPDLLMEMILRQLIEEGLVPHFYDLDYLDDIVAIIQSRYIGPNGVFIDAPSRRFLEALWLLCGKVLPLTDYQLVPGALKAFLGEQHPYVPPRKSLPSESVSNSLIPEFLDELTTMNAAANPERFLEICRVNFSRFNQKISASSQENRDLSIIYGYENNHHLILRKIIQLINDGNLSKNDPVLIIGPRHVDEVLFFRRYLGLVHTIGMDLFSDDQGLVIAGDMHQMPFEDGHFRLIYSANTFEYAYNLRLVIREIARVLKRSGYIANINRSNAQLLPMPLGRSDVVNLPTALGMYYESAHTVLAQDKGDTVDPALYGTFPNYVIRLD